jgi:hypothetical protein
MNRRGFLRRLGIGAVGVAVAVSIPASVVKAVGLSEHARERMLDKMHAIYVDHAKRGIRIREWHLGRDAFEAMEGELLLVERFVSTRYEGVNHLMFKGGVALEHGRGWGIAVTKTERYR